MATQTGSIDLRGANSAKLYVDDEAGEIRSEVSETYATKTEVRRTDTGSGTVITSDDAANLPPLSLTIHGKSVQDGTPTPSAPVAIESVQSRNILKPTARTVTSNGITYTCSADGLVTLSGTATATNRFTLKQASTFPAGTYTASKTGGTSEIKFGNNVAQTVTKTYSANWSSNDLAVYVYQGSTYDESFNVQLERGDTASDYMPYGAVELCSASRNILSPEPRTAADKGVTYTCASDGTITLQGTCTGFTCFTLKRSSITFPAGTYTFSKTGGESNVYWIGKGTERDSITQTTTGDTDIRNLCISVEAGKVYNETFNVQLERGSTATEYAPYSFTTTPIPVTLRSLPNGTEDVLDVDGEWNVTLTQRIGLTTTATTDGIAATVGTDAMSTTGTLADGATVIYKLATPQTISLGKIDLPSLPSPSFSLHVDAAVSPTLDAEWWTQGGEEVGSVYQRTTALEQDVDGITLELSEKVDSSEEWVSWLHAGTDATTHEPYLAMGKDSDYPSVVYGSDAARFYDGEGDAASNVVASFGTDGVVVGKDGSANTAITDSEIVFHDADGNEAGKISMSSEGAVPASASHTITAGNFQQTYTLEGLTPLPDFTLGSLVVDLFYNGTLLHKYIYTSFTGAEFAVSIDTYTDATFTAAQSGDTWGATLTAQHRVVGETADFTFSLKWVYRGTAPMYEFGTAENTGAYSFSAGTGLVAAGPSQAVFGTYNKASQTDLFIVGNGTSDEGRSNALKVDSQGTLETSGYFQLGGNVGLGTVAQEGWLTALGAPFLRFAEVTTATQSIPSGSIAYYDVAAPTYTGFTLRGAIQAWTSGSGTVIIGASYRSSADNYMHFVVRANNSASVAVKALLLYTRDAITFTS